MKKMLITGGAGFIGVNSAIYFSKRGWDITILDNLSRQGSSYNLTLLKKQLGDFTFINDDCVDQNMVKKAVVGKDAVLHLAGQTAVTTSIKDPFHDFRNNVLATVTLLEAVRKDNPTAFFIYSSTNKVYGDLQNHQFEKNEKHKKYEEVCHPDGIEEDTQLDFISPYGCSKGASDMYVLDYSRIYDLNTVVFRQSCIYGPYQMGVEDQGWVAHFSKQYLKKMPLTIFGDGYQTRDLLYIDDLCRAYEEAISKKEKVRGEAFNIGGGVLNAYSLLNIVDRLNSIFGYQINISFKTTRIGDQKYFVSANKKIKRYLDWEPQTDFKTGSLLMIDWQKQHLRSIS